MKNQNRTKLSDLLFNPVLLVVAAFIFCLATAAHSYGMSIMDDSDSTQAVNLDDSKPICLYVGSYKPITRAAIKAVQAAGVKSCSPKAEIQSYRINGTGFIKWNKTKLGAGQYNALYRQYMILKAKQFKK